MALRPDRALPAPAEPTAPPPPASLRADGVEGSPLVEVETEAARVALVPEPAAVGEEATGFAEGLFRLVHDDGRTEEDLDGEAEFVVWDEAVGGDQAGVNQTHPVVEGRFRLAVDPGDELEVRRVTLGGDNAVPVKRNAHHATGAGPIVIEERRPKRLVLHVTNAATGGHLDRVSAIVEPRRLFDMSGPAAYPGTSGEGETLFSEAASPVTVSPPADLAVRRRVVLHVGAPGYTWGRLVVNFSAGGEHRVELERAPGVGTSPCARTGRSS